MRAGTVAGTLRLFGGLLLAAHGAGCSIVIDRPDALERTLAAGHPAQALELLEKQGPGRFSQALFWLNKGMVLRLNEDYVASNESFAAAKREIEALYGVSVSEQAGAVSLNERLIRFKGEPFERVMLHAYMALNYLALGRIDEARVEVLQADVRMGTPGGEAFGENGFMRYLGGVIFETLGEMDNAYISYRKAYAYYREHGQVPGVLQRDLLRLARAQHREDDLKTYAGAFHGPPAPEVGPPVGGELVVLMQTGLVAGKREHITAAYDPVSNRYYSVALPYYPVKPESVSRVALSVDGVELSMAKIEDVSAQARRALERRLPAITARAVARMVIKTQAAHEAGKESELAGILVNVFSIATERADTRSWTTLPEALWLARLPLTPGVHRLSLTMIGPGGEVLARLNHEVEVGAGRPTLFTCHWMPPKGER